MMTHDVLLVMTPFVTAMMAAFVDATIADAVDDDNAVDVAAVGGRCRCFC